MMANPDWTDLLEAFADEGVECLIIGGIAYGFHAEPRATKDLDIWVRPTATNATRIVKALMAFGAPLQAHGVTEATFEDEELGYQIGLPPNRIDILGPVSGVRFEDAMGRSVGATYNRVPVRVIGIEDLIRTKASAGRAQDLLDVTTLERALRLHRGASMKER